jgi:hypothetical protein
VACQVFFKLGRLIIPAVHSGHLPFYIISIFFSLHQVAGAGKDLRIQQEQSAAHSHLPGEKGVACLFISHEPELAGMFCHGSAGCVKGSRMFVFLLI